MGSGLTNLGSLATLEDNLPTVFQIQNKVTWTKGRQLFKMGGQWLKYNQQRYYAGNNGALGLFGYSATYTGLDFSDFLLDQFARLNAVNNLRRAIVVDAHLVQINLLASLSVWPQTLEDLDRYLKDAAAFAPGSTKSIRIPNPDERRAIIDFLKTLE